MGNGAEVVGTAVRLVSRYSRNIEVLRSGLHQRREKTRIVSIFASDLDRCNYVGSCSNHQMCFDPFLLLAGGPVLYIKPTDESGSCKTAGIHGEINFYRLQRKTAFRDKVIENWGKFFPLKIGRNSVEMWHLGDKTSCISLPQIAHETPLRNSRVNLECSAKDGVTHRESRPSRFGLLRWNSTAKVAQEYLKLVLFRCLGSIVFSPFLRVGFLHRSYGRGLRYCAVRFSFAHDSVCKCKKMLARLLAYFKIGTGARVYIPCNIDRIFPVASLRRDEPNSRLFVSQLFPCRQLHTAFFSRFHKHLAYLRSILLSRYIVVKLILDNILLDGIFLSCIRFVRYGAQDHQTTGVRVLALRPSVGATQEHKGRTESLSKVQKPLLEQAPQEAQKGGTIKAQLDNCLPYHATWSFSLTSQYRAAFSHHAAHKLALPARIELATCPYEGAALSRLSYGSVGGDGGISVPTTSRLIGGYSIAIQLHPHEEPDRGARR